MPRSPQQPRTTVKCRACQRESQHRFRTGSHWTCPKCGEVQPGPARTEFLEERERRRQEKLKARRERSAAAAPEPEPSPPPAKPKPAPRRPAATVDPKPAAAKRPAPAKKPAASAASPAAKKPATLPPPAPAQHQRRRGLFGRILSGEWEERAS